MPVIQDLQVLINQGGLMCPPGVMSLEISGEAGGVCLAKDWAIRNYAPSNSGAFQDNV